MHLAQIRSRLDHERRLLARDGEVLDVLPAVTRLRAADASWHSVPFSSLSAQTANAAIAGEIEHHRRLGAAFEWKLYAHDRPPDLAQRLRRSGFEVGPREAVLVCDLTIPPPWMTGDQHATVVPVESEEQVLAFRRVAEAVFGKPYDRTAGELLAALRADSTQHRGYIACAGDEPVGIGRLYTHPDSHFAGLYGGGTLPAHRRRGFYRALVAARARDAARLGARYLIVDALPTSRPTLHRMGFQWLTDTWPCDWRP